jgi:hypothetical protein
LTSICYPPQACVKIKRYSPEMVGENLGKKCVSVSVLMAVSIVLEHDTPLRHLNLSWLIQFVSCLTFCKFISRVVFESILPGSLSCHSYVQEKFNRNLLSSNHLQLSILTMSAFPVSVPRHICILLYPKSVTYFVSLMGDTSRPSYDKSFPVDFSSLSRKKA